MTLVTAAQRGIPFELQTEATTGNGLALAIPSNFKHHTIYIKGLDIPSAGAVQIETADNALYAGTWAPLGGGPITVPDGETIYNFEGVFGAIRVPVSTPVTSGSVTVTYVGS